MSTAPFTLSDVPILVEGPAIWGKLFRVERPTLESCLEACQRAGSIPAKSGHGEGDPVIGHFQNFRRFGVCILGDFEATPDADPAGLSRVAAASVDRSTDWPLPGFSVDPERRFTPEGTAVFDAILSIDFCSAPSANPGGLRIPTPEDLERQVQRFEVELEILRKLRAEQAG